MNKNRIWIISELFFPDETSTAYILTEIARKLSEYCDVYVICGSSIYEKNTKIVSKNKKLPKSIFVHRVFSLGLNKNILLFKLLNIIISTFSISINILVKVKRGDRVLLVTNPAFIMPIASIIGKLKKFKLFVLVHDVFPDNLIPIGYFNNKNIFYKLLIKIFNHSYAYVHKIIVIGRDMKGLFLKKIGFKNSNKIEVIENWAEIEEVISENEHYYGDLYKNKISNDKLIFQFAGNLGRLQGLQELMEIIKEIKNPNLYFVFIGEGAMKSNLSAFSKEYNNVLILDSMPRIMQNDFLNACSCGIVSLNDGMLGLGVPSKTYNILAAGKPIFYLGDKKSEVAQMIDDYNVGWHYNLNQKTEILEFLDNVIMETIKNKSKNCRNTAETIYSKKIILNKFKKLLIDGE